MCISPFRSKVQRVDKPIRIYHAKFNKWGNVIKKSFGINEEDTWVTVRLDGESRDRCYQINCPYVHTLD